MKQDTGIMLSEIQGPLENLLTNLSGKYGKYWLSALKKMLRKEKVPALPPEALITINDLKDGKKVEEDLDKLYTHIEKIPVIKKIEKTWNDNIVHTDYGLVLLDIFVCPNFLDFLKRNEETDEPVYVLYFNGKVGQLGDIDDIDGKDSIFESWHKKYFPKKSSIIDLKTFYEALFELSISYQNSIPGIPSR